MKVVDIMLAFSFTLACLSLGHILLPVTRVLTASDLIWSSNGLSTYSI